MYQLTESQKKLLFETELSSFNRHCKENGWDPGSKEKEYYEQEINFINNAKNGVFKRVGVSDHIDTYFSQITLCETYWELLSFNKEEKKQQIINEIKITLPDLLVNHEYLFKLSKRMNISIIPENKPESIANLLLNIPVMNAFELDFNAFVQARSMIGNMPIVCYYTVLPGLIRYFSDLFLFALLAETKFTDKNAHIQIPDDEILQEIATKKDFRACCGAAILSLLSKNNGLPKNSTCSFTNKYPEFFPEFLEVMYGASYFVSFHEYSHILLGHTEMKHTHSLELDADLMATQILLLSAKTKQQVTLRVLGLSILLGLLEIIYELDPPIHKTHPSPTERLLQLDRAFPTINLLLNSNKVERLWLGIMN